MKNQDIPTMNKDTRPKRSDVIEYTIQSKVLNILEKYLKLARRMEEILTDAGSRMLMVKLVMIFLLTSMNGKSLRRKSNSMLKTMKQITPRRQRMIIWVSGFSTTKLF